MKIGVSSYSFSRLLRAGELSGFDVITKAKEMGFEAVDFSGLPVPEGKTPESCAERLREHAEQAGVPIAAYTIGADFLTGSGGNLEDEIERVKHQVRIAQILGVPRMRHDATRGFPADHTGARGFGDALPILVKGCLEVTKHAADLGVQTMVENHGFFCQDSERMERLVNGVNHPNFGLLVDIGNFLCADEDPAPAVGRLAPYIFHVHAKDFHVKSGLMPNPGQGWIRSRAGNYIRGAIIGHGEVPVVQCLRTLKISGYEGFLSIEFEGMEEPLNGIAIGRENLARFLETA
jgi:sugar phosphate isomerase/epimerase